MLKNAIFLSSCALLVSACGSQYILYIDTVPSGATIWQVGASNSYTTPVELAPDPNYRHPTTNCILTNRVYAKWQSGATTASQDPLQLCGKFDAWTLTLRRPSSYPGLETDLMVEQRILLERQPVSEHGAAALSAGVESLGRALGCSAGGGRCSSTPYSYLPPARTEEPVRTYQGVDSYGDDPPVPDLDLDLDLVLPGEEPTRNRCPPSRISEPYCRR